MDVVIPTDRRHPFLYSAVQSARQQHNADVHVIVVDDGSSDAVWEQVESWSLPGVSVMRHNRNRGAGAARNTGVTLGSRPWLGFLDSDDLWPHHRTEQLVATAVSNDALLIGQQQIFDATGAPNPADSYSAVGEGTAMLAGAMLFPRTVMEALGPFDEDLVLGEFVDWMRVARDRAVREQHIRCVSLLRRSHAANITRTRVDAHRDYLTVIARARRDRGLSPEATSANTVKNNVPTQ